MEVIRVGHEPGDRTWPTAQDADDLESDWEGSSRTALEIV